MCMCDKFDEAVMKQIEMHAQDGWLREQMCDKFEAEIMKQNELCAVLLCAEFEIVLSPDFQTQSTAAPACQGPGQSSWANTSRPGQCLSARDAMGVNA